MDRREWLSSIGAASFVAIAGCVSEDDEGRNGNDDDNEDVENREGDGKDNSESEEGNSENETNDEEQAQFEFSDVTSDGETFSTEDEIMVRAELENTGDKAGEQTIGLMKNGELIDEKVFELEPNETAIPGLTYDPDTLPPGEWEFTFTSEDGEITTTFTVEEAEVEEPDTQSFSGNGQEVKDSVDIQGGLTVVEATHEGESNFQVSLVDGSEYNDNFINVIGEFDGAQANLIGSGEYMLEINADGKWEIEVHQPRAASGNDLPESLSGSGPDVIGPINFSGTHVAEGSHSGSSNFQVQIFPMEGRFSEVVFNEIGEFEGETTFSHEGVGWVDVNADGDWSIEIE